MRVHCWFCQKPVSSELPADAVFRCVNICPECIPHVVREDAQQMPAGARAPDTPTGFDAYQAWRDSGARQVIR